MQATNSFENISWKTAWTNRKFRLSLILSVFVLLVVAWFAPALFRYIETRPGTKMSDPILELIPVRNVSAYVFIILYMLICTGVIFLIRHPKHLAVALTGYTILTLMRFVTLLIVPLEIPAGLIVLSDPFTDNLFYRQTITKDLFFSGHTSILLFLGFCIHKRIIKTILISGGIVVGILVLVQHAHYSIDVIAALPAAWIAYRAGMWVVRSWFVVDSRL